MYCITSLQYVPVCTCLYCSLPFWYRLVLPCTSLVPLGTSLYLLHLESVEMAFTWYIPGISPPYDHVGDIGGIYQVYTRYIPIYFHTWYIPGIYQHQSEGIYLVYTWYIPGTSCLQHLGIYLVYTRYRLNPCNLNLFGAAEMYCNIDMDTNVSFNSRVYY